MEAIVSFRMTTEGCDTCQLDAVLGLHPPACHTWQCPCCISEVPEAFHEARLTAIGGRCGSKSPLRVVLFTAKYKTQSKLPTPLHFCQIKISDLVIISNPMGETLKFLLVTPNFFCRPHGKIIQNKISDPQYFSNLLFAVYLCTRAY